MSRPWCRLYTGTRNHRKIRILREKCPETWAYWYVLIELAGEVNDSGWIYVSPDHPFSDKQMAKELGIRREDTWKRLRSHLEELELITVNEQGILLNSFAERNFESDSSTPRVQKYRERKKSRPPNETFQGNVTETPQNRTDTEQIQNRTDTDTPLPPSRGKKLRKKLKIPLPPDFNISEEVKRWAEEKGHNHLSDHLEAFKEWALSTGKEYLDWDATFKRAIREDWGKIKQRSRDDPRCSQPGLTSWLQKKNAGVL